jgi:integrase
MRRGEILGLTRKQVNLAKRIVTLSPEDTKEAHWKRIPVHRDLVPILEESLKVTSLETDKVFLLHDKQGGRPIELETFKNPWPRACEALEKAELLKQPFPRFHDLRHTWKTNARRSGMDLEIRESILGHATKEKSVTLRYGRISDQELIQAIDNMTFDHGDTEILVVNSSAPKAKVNKSLTRQRPKRKSGCTPL